MRRELSLAYSLLAVLASLCLLVVPAAQAQNIDVNVPANFDQSVTFTGNNTHSGTETFTGPIVCQTLENIQCVDGTHLTIAGAIAALPSTGGVIYISSIGSPYSVALGALTISKNIKFMCENPKNTVINFTGTSGVAFLFNNTIAGLQDWGEGIENCQIIGPGGYGGSGNNAGTGIQTGDSTHFMYGISVKNSIITGFAVGHLNAAAGAAQAQFMEYFQHDSFLGNTQEIVSTITSGTGGGTVQTVYDDLNFTQSVSASNPGSITIGGSIGQSEIFQNCYFDSEQFSISGAADVQMIDAVFENSTGNTTNNFITFAGQLLTLIHPTFLQDFSTGSIPTEFVSASLGNLIARDWRAESNETMQTVFRTTGSASYIIWGNRETDGVTADLIDTSSSTHKTFLDRNNNLSTSGTVAAALSVANRGTACTNAELAFSAGWGSTTAASAVAGTGQTCQWTVTSTGTGQGANPTITDTLTNPLPSALTVCEMRMVGGTGMTTLINQTTLSATKPVFTFGGTPVVSDTYIVLRRCGP